MRACSSLLFCVALAALPCSAGEKPSAAGKSAIDDGPLRRAVEQIIYRIKPTDEATYRGENPAQRLSVEFNAEGTRLQHPRGAVAFRLTGYGYGSQLRTPAPARPVANGAGIEYRRGDLTEWYLNEAEGVEQGFTLERRPEAARKGEPLVIALAVEGELRPRLTARGGAVLLETAGHGVLRYGGLRSWDARGRPVAARLEASEREIRLVVEDRDAEYPLVVDPFWTQQAELTASDGAGGDQFGVSVSISGDTALIGAPNKFGGLGAAYVFIRSGAIWTMQAELEVFSGGGNFGESVAVQGNTAVIGSPTTDLGSGPQGAAFVFVRSGTTWNEQQELIASDGAVGDEFGNSVALDGNTAVIGAFFKTIGANRGQGAAYVFVNNGSVWVEQQELTASDGATNDFFGCSVSISGSTALIGAIEKNSGQGAGYVFVNNGSSWIQQQELTASNAANGNGLGNSVAISGTTAMLGAPGAGSNGEGAAYVFVNNGSTWTQQQELIGSDGAPGDALGCSVSLDVNIAVLGACDKTIGANPNQGAAYVFVNNGIAWTQQQELIASDGASADSFGFGASVSGFTALVGAFGKTVNGNMVQGAAYVFLGSDLVSTSPAGLSFAVDGVNFTSAQSFQWAPGSMHALSTTSPQSGAGSQSVFTNWSDGGSISHTVIASTIPTAYQATFGLQYQLSVSVSPAGSGTVSPASGFFNAGSTIPLQAIPAPGFVFTSWTGPVASFTSVFTTITLSGPTSITANFQLVPVSIANPSVGPATVGVGIGQQFLAKGGFPPYSWSATGLPVWLNLSSSGFLTGTPPPGSAGTYTFTVRVSDSGNSAPGSAGITLLVNPAPLAITTSQLTPAKEGSPYNAPLSATGGTTPYSWTGSGLPSWLSVSAAGTLSGTPPVGSAGGVAFTVTVTDAAGMKASANLQLAIAPASGKPIVATPPALPQATVGSFYTLTLAAVGGTPPYRWTEQNIGSGLSLNSSGVLSGVPTTAGTLSFTAQVSDSASPTGTAFQAFSLTIVPQPVAVTNLSLAEAHLGIPYLQTFSASGGSQKFVWSVLSGTLPPGLTLDSTGILSGTPTSAVTSSFTIGATDVGANTTPAPSVREAPRAVVKDTPHAASPAASAGFQIVVEPSKTDLALSVGSLVFTGVANGSDPPTQNISVISTDANTPLPFSVTTDAPWLFVTQNGGTTPANVVVTARIIGLQVQNYSGHITFSSPGLTPQIVGVSFSVASPATAPPAVVISPSSVQLSTVAGSTIPLPFSVLVRNSGVGSISFTASAIGAPWLSVVSTTGSILANATGTVSLQADPTGLAPGFHLGTVEVDSPNSSAQIPVTLFLATAGRISLSFSGALVEARAGSPPAAPATLSFSVLGSDSNPIAFTAQQIGGDGILALQTTSGSATNQAPAPVSYTVNTTGLAAGAYYGRILVSAPSAVDSPQTYLVVINVSPVTQPPDPAPSPAGLVFVSGASTPPKQTVAVFTSSAGNVAFQAAASTQDGAGWLSVTPATGILSSSSPAQLTVIANPAGLKPGVYRGSVSIAETNLAVRSVNVTLIVTAAAQASSGSVRAEAACSPSQLVITQTGIAGNFSAPAAWPQTLAIALNDDCGNAIAGGSVAADFSNGDPSLPLSLSDPHSGTYTATWTPTHNTAQMTITAKANAGGFPNASAQLVGSVTPNVAPALAANGVLHNFYPQVGAPLAPGTIVEIFGSAMAGTTQSAATTPLPTSIGGTSVVIGGLEAPLFFVSPGQINAQIPNELAQGNSYDVVVIANTAVTTPQPVQLNLRAPGVARFADGHVIAQHGDFSLVTAQSPAQPGEYLVIYLGGLGPGNETVASGTTSPSIPLDAVPDVTITVDGQSAPLLFSGLTPGLVGLYQVNFQVPANVSSGDVMLQVVQDGYVANSSLLTVAAH